MSLARNIRIYYECEDGIDKSDPRSTHWHHEACLTNKATKMATASMHGSRKEGQGVQTPPEKSQSYRVS